MTGALILLHRWLGIACCLLFAMWFASGIVMHFVPFPALTEAARIGGLAPVKLEQVRHGPAEAAALSGLASITRIKLTQRIDGPIYLVTGLDGRKALRAADLSDAAVHSEELARAIVVDHVRRRGIEPSRVAANALTLVDQWTVSGSFDVHRPLYRAEIDNPESTEIYVSGVTGEIVLATTRHERWANYFGSVAHWIYPTMLRSKPALWSAIVWVLSLAALMVAISGSVLGTMRMKPGGALLVSPYAGLQAWHHVLGLISMTFTLTWIFSGWLSMDTGLLFSSGSPTATEVATFHYGFPARQPSFDKDVQTNDPSVREIEWFAINGQIGRRERTGLTTQRLILGPSGEDNADTARTFLRAEDLHDSARHLAQKCSAPVVVGQKDPYAVVSHMSEAPIYRIVCNEKWFHVDGASGTLLQKLDASRRAYRWLYAGLHKLDFPVLAVRPALRTSLIVTLCGLGFFFSLTGAAIGWRRLNAARRRK
jgi:hypothetical protein